MPKYRRWRGLYDKIDRLDLIAVSWSRRDEQHVNSAHSTKRMTVWARASRGQHQSALFDVGRATGAEARAKTNDRLLRISEEPVLCRFSGAMRNSCVHRIPARMNRLLESIQGLGQPIPAFLVAMFGESCWCVCAFSDYISCLNIREWQPVPNFFVWWRLLVTLVL